MSAPRLDLREMPNSGCLGCDRMARKDFLENGLCKQTQSVLDQLPVRCVGGWAYDKVYRLVQYFGIFASGMKNQWLGLSSGHQFRCSLRESRWGRSRVFACSDPLAYPMLRRENAEPTLPSGPSYSSSAMEHPS